MRFLWLIGLPAFILGGCSTTGQTTLSTTTSNLCAQDVDLSDVTVIDAISSLSLTDESGNSLLSEDAPTYAHTVSNGATTYETLLVSVSSGVTVYETLLIPLDSGRRLFVQWETDDSFYSDLSSEVTETEVSVLFYESVDNFDEDLCLYRNTSLAYSSSIDCLGLINGSDLIDHTDFSPVAFSSNDNGSIILTAEATLDELGTFEILFEAQISTQNIVGNYPDYTLVAERIEITSQSGLFDDESCGDCPDDYPSWVSSQSSDEYECRTICANYSIRDADDNFVSLANEETRVSNNRENSTLCRESEGTNNDVSIEQLSL